jgi:hypothetical protein
MEAQMEQSRLINIELDFARYPAGRYLTDGPYSGQAFREGFLVPALRILDARVVIEFDGARGYGSSFLEEAFGGLVREGFSAEDLFRRIDFRSSDKSLVEEIRTYIKDQAEVAINH